MSGNGVASPIRNDRFDPAWQVVVDGAERGAYAGAVALVTWRQRCLMHRATGWATKIPEPIAMTPETIFDLASLTKVVATLPVVVRLVGDGHLDLERPVGAVLPRFGCDGAKGAITIRHLLNHTAGLAAWRPLYLDHRGADAYLDAIARLEPTHPVGAREIYSDLGFILLGEVVHQITGERIDRIAQREMFAPLGMSDTGYQPSTASRSRIAATEHGNATEIAMCGPRAGQFRRWRRDPIWGEANDGNAFYGLDGVAGHAGLFGTAADLARYGHLWLAAASRDTTLLPGTLAREAIRPVVAGRGLGWRLQGGTASAAAPAVAPALGPRAFGHTGFTGTSLWIDPARELVAILLTNRLHPTARPEIAAIRTAFHAALATAIPARTPRSNQAPRGGVHD